MTNSKVINPVELDNDNFMNLTNARTCEFRFKRDREDTIEHEGETLCRVVYDNGCLGGYIGEDVFIKDSYISPRSKVYGESRILDSVIYRSSVYFSVIRSSRVMSSDLIRSEVINSKVDEVSMIRFRVKDSNILENHLSSKPSFYTGG